MSFNSKSWEHLRKLRENYSRNFPSTESSGKQKSKNSNNLHPVEFESDPNELFRKLVDISPDGNIPSHLINRLKEIEFNQLNVKENQNYNHSSNTTFNKGNATSNKKMNKTTKEEILYASFDQFLLEDED